MAQKMEFDKILYGGDYNPEQWLDEPEILEKDIQLMKQAHINTVSVGIFSWSSLEPVEGEYHFDWLENVIERLHQEGISIILATPSGARPKWMADKYPEVLRVDESRRKMLFGMRHNHCYTSSVYREKVKAINTELAKRFGKHEAVLMWHISNEFGGECHCELCQNAFRGWLKDRYKTIEQLNKAWNTTFWSHTYQDFSQVESPSSIGECFLHGLNLDWKRFVTHQTRDFVKYEIQAIRDAGSFKPTTMNMMYYYKGLDYTRFADVIDVVSWDNYPTWHKTEESVTAMDTAMQHDFMRSIMHKPFLLMESCPSSTNWQSVSKLKKPGMLEAASLQALAHGSDSVLYFQIRQSRGASEKFHGAVIDHYGKADTRVFGEVTETGNKLTKLSEIIGSQVEAKGAIIYDMENIWAMEDAQGPRNKNLYVKETLEKSYSALRKLGLNVDVITQEQDITGYQIVLAPMLYMFKQGFAERAKAYVEQGGTLIMTYWSGIVDDTDICYLDGVPYGMMDVFGLRSEEIDGLYDGEKNYCKASAGNSLGLEGTYTCKNLCDLVKTTTAETLMTYTEDFYAGNPALTCNVFGKGKAYYVCADMEQDFYDDFVKAVVKELQIETIFPGWEIPEGVEVTSRKAENTTYIFIQNYGKNKVEIPQIPNSRALLETADGKLKQFETAIFAISQSDF